MRHWSPEIVRCPGCGAMKAVRKPNGNPTTCVSPLRAAADSPRQQLGAASSLGVTPGSSLTASSPSGDALGRSRAGRSRREVGLAAERQPPAGTGRFVPSGPQHL